MSILISVIVCTYNRQQSLSKTVESLLAQKTNENFNYEILIVDNKSTDNTRDIVYKYAAQFPGRIKYVWEPKQGKTCALNRGIQEAKGQILVFTDDDVVADSHWLEAIVQCFSSCPCDAIGGRVLPIYPEGTPEWIKENAVKMAGGVVIYDQGLDVMPLDQSKERFIGANFAFKKEVFAECGGFREDLGPGRVMSGGEDRDIFYRLLKHNKTIFYCGQALIWHPVDLRRLTLGHLARWHIAMGRVDVRIKIENKTENEVYFFRIPRYLFRGIFVDFCRLCVLVFDRVAWHDAWRSFFCKIGMIIEYRANTKSKGRK